MNRSARHKKALAVWGDVVIHRDRVEAVRPREQTLDLAAAERFAKADGRREERVSFREKEFAPVSRPHGSRAPINRHLTARARPGKRAHVDLGPAGFVSHVRDPAAVRREGCRQLVGRALEERRRRPIVGGEDPHVLTGRRAYLPIEQPPSIWRPAQWRRGFGAVEEERGGAGTIDRVREKADGATAHGV